MLGMSVVKLSSLLIDAEAERDGEWIDIREWQGLDPDRPWEVVKMPGLRFKVRSINEDGYRLARQRMVESFEARKSEFPNGVIPSDLVAQEEGAVIADRLLLGWEGLDEAYSADLARRMLVTMAARPLREMIISCASRVGKRRLEFVGAAAKN